MQSSVDNYFITLEEPQRSCLLFLRSFILGFSDRIEERRKNNTPFYYYDKKWFCFISYHPKTKIIYLSFVNGYRMEHPGLLSEGRKKMKIFYVDPARDIDVRVLEALLKSAAESVY